MAEMVPLNPQDVWAAVADAAGRWALNGTQMGELRAWAGQRMREMPGTVWNDDSTMRDSFETATDIAARALAGGGIIS